MNAQDYVVEQKLREERDRLRAELAAARSQLGDARRRLGAVEHALEETRGALVTVCGETLRLDAEVITANAKLEAMEPLRSALDSWDWRGLAADMDAGEISQADLDVAFRMAARAFAAVEQAEEEARAAAEKERAHG